MSRIAAKIDSFNAGELSETMAARLAVEKVTNGCAVLSNMLPHVHGPVVKRPGLEFVGFADDDAVAPRLLEFNFSATTRFVIEFCEGVFRFWSNGQLVTVDDVPVTVSHPYQPGEFFAVQSKQINDVVYLVHPNHPPQKLTRKSDTNWTCEPMPFVFPPLADENVPKEFIATPVVTDAFTMATQEWHEFTVPAGSPVLIVANQAVGYITGTKTAKLQHWSGSTWVDSISLVWTGGTPATHTSVTFADDTVCRITYAGPSLGTLGLTRSKIVAVDNVTPTVTYDTLDISDGESIGVGSTFQTPNGTKVLVGAGESWQVVVTCPADVPEDVELTLQRLDGGGWKEVNNFPMEPERSSIYTVPVTKKAQYYRLMWSGRAMEGTAKMQILAYPTNNTVGIGASGTAGSGVTLTATNDVFLPGHVGAYFGINHRKKTSSVSIKGVVGYFKSFESPAIRAVGRWDVYTYGTWKGTLYLERRTAQDTWDIIREWSSSKDRNVIANGEEATDAELRLRVSSDMYGYDTSSTSVDVPRFLLECADSLSFGIVKITAVTDARHATCNVIRALGDVEKTTLWAEGAWSDVQGYPSTVATHEGRLWFGGCAKQPSMLWASVSNDYENFRRGTNDDASIAVALAAEMANYIRWLSSSDDALLIGTGGEEWVVRSNTQGQPITPTNIKALRRSAYSSAGLPARPTQDAILFVQRDLRRIRQIAYSPTDGTLSAADMTALARHVTEGGIKQLAVQQSPQNVVWVVTNDGRLVSLTFEREQNVFAWAQHQTTGLVKSVAIMTGSPADEVWLAVQRNERMCIERFDPLAMSGNPAEWQRTIYLDGASRFTSPGTSINAAHLAGLECVALLDGVPFTVTAGNDGAVTLPEEATYVVLGLPFTATCQPMPRELQMQDGTAQGKKWKVSRVIANVMDSKAGTVADSLDGRPEALPFRCDGLFTGQLDTAITAETRDKLEIVFRDDSPFPFTLRACVIHCDVYG